MHGVHTHALQIPEGISFDQAASVPLALATIVLALWDHNPRTEKSVRFTPPWEENGLTQYAGKPALIIGGASSVGQYGSFSTFTEAHLHASSLSWN